MEQRGKRRPGPDARKSTCASDQQEVPAFLLHHVTPADALKVPLGRRGIAVGPDVVQQFAHAAEGAEVGGLAETVTALLEHGAEGGAGDGRGAGDEQRPDQRSIEPVRSSGDVVHQVGEEGDEVADAGLPGLVAGHQTAEVDARRDAEHGGDVHAELLGSDGSGRGEAALDAPGRSLGGADLVGQDFDVFAKHQLVEPFGFLDVQAGDLGDEEHDVVLAPHELGQATGLALHVQLAIGIGKGGRASQHRRPENVDPGGQGHVERRMGVAVDGDVGDGGGQVELVDQADGGLEVLVPWDVGEGVIGAADGALEEDHAERGLEDLRMLRVLAERLAELLDRGVPVTHDVVIDVIAVQRLGGLHVGGGDAQTAVQVGFVVLQRRKNDVGSRRAMLVGIHDGEDQLHDPLQEVVEQILVVIVDVDDGFVVRRERTMRELEEVEVDRLLRQGFLMSLVVVLLDPAVGRVAGEARRERWRLIGAEGGDGGVFARGHIVDEDLSLGLDVDLVGRGEHGVWPMPVANQWLGRWWHLEVAIVGVVRQFATGRVWRADRSGAGLGDGIREDLGGGRSGMAQTGRGVDVQRGLRRLLGQLGVLDQVLDLLLLLSTQLAVAPPHGPLVIASQAEMLARLARGSALLALLPPQSAVALASDGALFGAAILAVAFEEAVEVDEDIGCYVYKQSSTGRGDRDWSGVANGWKDAMGSRKEDLTGLRLVERHESGCRRRAANGWRRWSSILDAVPLCSASGWNGKSPDRIMDFQVIARATRKASSPDRPQTGDVREQAAAFVAKSCSPPPHEMCNHTCRQADCVRSGVCSREGGPYATWWMGGEDCRMSDGRLLHGVRGTSRSSGAGVGCRCSRGPCCYSTMYSTVGCCSVGASEREAPASARFALPIVAQRCATEPGLHRRVLRRTSVLPYVLSSQTWHWLGLRAGFVARAAAAAAPPDGEAGSLAGQDGQADSQHVSPSLMTDEARGSKQSVEEYCRFLSAEWRRQVK
nr:hypothetical protein CFP56_04104 [Quercus suber]